MSSNARRLMRRIRFRLSRVSDRSLLLCVAGASIIGTIWSFADYGDVRVPSVAIIVMVFGSLFLSSRAMVAIVALLGGCVLAVLLYHHAVSSQLSFSGGVMLISVAVVCIAQTARRDALGLRRTSPESVLEKVGAQLRAQGRIPVLPGGWNVDVAQHTAFGAAFAGDFVSSRLRDDNGIPKLDVVLVDVSGRGIEAGSRALLFSGAIGGLLGEVDPEQFLTSANDYLVRQHVEAGFASASYVHVNLATGRYQLFSAGHPPAIIWGAKPQASRRSDSSGIVLGVVDDLDLKPISGVLAPGDALVLYTDGVVESRTTDLETGIVALEERLAHVESVRGSRRLAEDLLEGARGNDDDQTVVVIWADPSTGIVVMHDAEFLEHRSEPAAATS
jgi:Stage II sporulation protein E (SpoIIE)